MSAKHQFCAHCKCEVDLLHAVIEPWENGNIFWVFCSQSCRRFHLPDQGHFQDANDPNPLMEKFQDHLKARKAFKNYAFR